LLGITHYEDSPSIFICDTRPSHRVGHWLYSTDHYYNKWIRRYRIQRAFDGINDRYAPLNAVRSGDTNGTVELLESRMDGQIMLLESMIQDLHVDQLPPWDLRILARARDYRAEYPRKTNSLEINQIIVSVLSLTNTQSHP
jgi:hypothetical protein